MTNSRPDNRPDNDVNATPKETNEPLGQWTPVTPQPPLSVSEPSPSSVTARRFGPYVLEHLIGSGGYGEVWLATREGEIAHTRLAVKLPHPSHVDLTAIRQEAGLWAQIGSHPNILPIFEASVYDGQVVIVSEYAAGGSLAEWLKRHGGKASTPDEAVQIILGVLAGLEHLHSLGVVHRDIKPANVLLQNNIPRLTDFGISRVLHTANPTGRPLGTPAFMAPEAFDGDRSVQTDIWSVGVMFYQLLTGSLPFPEREWSSLLKAILTRDPAPLPTSLADKYGDILRNSLAKDRTQRFLSASEMAARLKSAAEEPAPRSNAAQVLAHLAAFHGSMRFALFINVTNLSESVDREVTHVWIETEPKIYVENVRRRLPRRLKPQETWETWIEFWKLPRELLNDDLPTLVRARLSTGEVLHGSRNESVPESGWIPGGSDDEELDRDIDATPDPPPPKKPWWRFW